MPEYWVVDPAAKSVEQQVLAGNRYALQGKFGDRIACRSLPGVNIDLTRVW